MSHCKGTIKHSGTAASDKFSASEGDHFFEYACRQGCPNARVKNSQALSLDIKLIDGMCPNFTPQMFDDTLGFKYRLCCIIELKNRIVVLDHFFLAFFGRM